MGDHLNSGLALPAAGKVQDPFQLLVVKKVVERPDVSLLPCENNEKKNEVLLSSVAGAEGK